MKFWLKLFCLPFFFLLAHCQSAPPVENIDAMKARIHVALAYLAQQNYPKAKQNIDKAEQLAPQHYLPYSIKAYYFQLLDALPQAMQAYQQAIALNPNPTPDLRNNFGTLLCQQGNFDEAFAQFDAALQSQQPYYRQADTLENVMFCALRAADQARYANALDALRKLDKTRASQWR